jgi:hypothetical protein
MRPKGDLLGGRMYPDAAYTVFRKLNPDDGTLVADHVLSVQRGSPSTLAHKRQYDRCPPRPVSLYKPRAPCVKSVGDGRVGHSAELRRGNLANDTVHQNRGRTMLTRLFQLRGQNLCILPKVH